VFHVTGPGSFVPIPGVIAVRIAVDQFGHPWVVTSTGSIYAYINDVWVPIATDGCVASDIGIGANGDVWIVSCHTAGSNGNAT
jgi:hypothetical protein